MSDTYEHLIPRLPDPETPTESNGMDLLGPLSDKLGPPPWDLDMATIRKLMVNEGRQFAPGDLVKGQALGNARMSLIKWGFNVDHRYMPDGRVVYYVPGAPSEALTAMLAAHDKGTQAAVKGARSRQRAAGRSQGRPPGAKNKPKRVEKPAPVEAPAFDPSVLQLGDQLTVVVLELTDAGERRVRLRGPHGDLVFIGPNS